MSPRRYWSFDINQANFEQARAEAEQTLRDYFDNENDVITMEEGEDGIWRQKKP